MSLLLLTSSAPTLHCTKNLIDNPKRDEERFGVNYKTITFAGDISSAGLNVGDLISFQRGAEPDETYTVTVKRVDTFRSG